MHTRSYCCRSTMAAMPINENTKLDRVSQRAYQRGQTHVRGEARAEIRHGVLNGDMTPGAMAVAYVRQDARYRSEAIQRAAGKNCCMDVIHWIASARDGKSRVMSARASISIAQYRSCRDVTSIRILLITGHVVLLVGSTSATWYELLVGPITNKVDVRTASAVSITSLGSIHSVTSQLHVHGVMASVVSNMGRQRRTSLLSVGSHTNGISSVIRVCLVECRCS